MFQTNTSQKIINITGKGNVVDFPSSLFKDYIPFKINVVDKFNCIFGICNLMFGIPKPNINRFMLQHDMEKPLGYIKVCANLGIQLYVIHDKLLTSSINSEHKLCLLWKGDVINLMIHSDSKLARWCLLGLVTFEMPIVKINSIKVPPIITWPYVNLDAVAYDLGGTPDSAILCFLARFYNCRLLPSIPSLYRLMQLNEGNFINVESLLILSRFFCTNLLLLICDKDGQHFQYYQLGFDVDISLLLIVPYHYCLLRGLYSEGINMIDKKFNPIPGKFASDQSSFYVEYVLHLLHIKEYVYSVTNYFMNLFNPSFNYPLLHAGIEVEYQVEVISDIDDFSLQSEDDSDETSINTGEITILTGNSDAELVFHYMRNFGDMSSESVYDVFICFRNLHIEVCNLTIKYAENNQVLPSIFYKYYYKCRHNTFSFLCIQGLNRKDMKLETDVPLKKYIDSNKTPDFIIEDKESIRILEFTVANRYDQVDLIKGGGIIDVKYQAEVDEIMKKMTKKCTISIVPCVLNEYNIEEIEELMGQPLKKDLLRSFFDTCNNNREVISSAYFDSVSNTQGLIKGKFTPPLTNELMGIDAFFVSLVLKNWSWFLSYCVSLSTREEGVGKVSLCYDINEKKARIDTHPSNNHQKIAVSDLIDILTQHDLSRIISIVNVFDSGRLIGLKGLSGDIMLTIKNKEKVRHRLDYIDTNTNLHLYNIRASKGDDYDLIECWDENMVKSKSEVLYDFDEHYLDQLCSFNYSELLSNKDDCLLANNTITTEYINESVILLRNEYLKSNQNPRFKFSPKPSFTWPLVSGQICNSSLALDPNFLKSIILCINGDYTKHILNMASIGKFYSEAERTQDIIDLTVDFSEKRMAYTNFLINNNLVKRYKYLTKEERLKVAFVRQDFMNAQQKRSKALSQCKRSSNHLIKILMNPKSMMKSAFLKEMSHYDKKNKGLRGVGTVAPEHLKEYFIGFHERLLSKGYLKSNESLFNKSRSPGLDFFTQQKDQFTSNWSDFLDKTFNETLLNQLGHVIDRLSKFLFNESMKPYGNDFVKIDNLGFDRILVILRGGSKAAKNNTSRLFRIIFPIDKEDLKYSGYEENENFQIFNLQNSFFVITPWSQYHLDVLYDGFSARERMFTSLYSNCVRTGQVTSENISMLSILPHTLMLNNRRKLESLMHNMRYLIVNPLGKYANIKGIIKSFGTFNHTYFGAWIKNSICENYARFAEDIQRIFKTGNKNLDNMLRDKPLKDMFFNQPILNAEHLTFHIYGTYLMTKAPVNNTIEQVNNLKEILEDVELYEQNHSDVNGMQDKSQHINVFNFTPKAYEDDFNYDPVFSQYLGFHMASFLRNKITPSEISIKWDQLLNQGISSIANSNGLRGYNPTNFFSKKGFEVVFDKVIDMMEESDLKLDEMVEHYLKMDYRTACEAVKADMIRKSDLLLEKITFHIVHKIQRGGGREIFCMDLMTKMFQNPIEMLMKYLCKYVPNEFISIPSNKRHNLIHRDFYERTPAPWIKETIRWVLDCRRWAPHSVFQKYVHFIHGMSSILPGSFINYFGAFADKMFEKEFCTREHVIKAMEKNLTFSELKNLLVKDVKIPGKYNVKVKFSFVMGIFNYLSTLMHSANQMVASEICMRNNLAYNRGLVVMDAKCHSDDSVVTTYHEHKQSIKPTVLIYDWLLKCSNHMLSIKKSQVNENVYLEFLSTLYLFDRFVPVVPKFVSSLPFKPTDLGYSTDVTFAASQSIEMLLQGGTLEESFLMLKISERFIQKIYNINSNNKNPYSLMGNIDSHPLELLLSGVESDIINHYMYNKKALLETTSILIRNKIISPSGYEGFKITWDMSSKISLRLKTKYSKWSELVDSISCKYPWTLTQCKLGNDYLQLIWFINKLSNPKYYASMTQEPDSRRFSRAFGSYKYRNIFLTNGGLIKASDLTNILQFESVGEVETHKDVEDYYENMLSTNPYMVELHDVLSTTELTGNSRPCGFKVKPVSLLLSASRTDNIKLSTQDIVSYIYEQDAFKLLGKSSDPKREVDRVKTLVSSMGLVLGEDTASAAKMIDFSLGRKEPRYSLIAPVPSEEKRVEDYNGVISYLIHNSIFGEIIDITTTRADVIDWSKKISKGKTPSAVLDYVEICQLSEIVESNDIQDIDLFQFNIYDKKEELFQEIPISWKPLVYASQRRELKNLIEEQYWIAWLKRQVKVGRTWYGSGSAIVCLPETTLQIDILNGIINKISVKEEIRGELSTTSNWYLLNFLSTPGLRLPTMESDVANPSLDYIGINNKTGRYGFGGPRGFDRVFEKPLHLGIENESMLYCTKYVGVEGRYYMVDNGNSVIPVEFYNPGLNSSKLDFGRYLDKDKVLKNINNKKVKDFCLKVSYELRSEFTFKREDVVDTIGFTKLYKIIFNNPDSMAIFRGSKDPDVLYESFPMWKATHPDFGFPTELEIDQLINDQSAPQLPSRIMRMLHKMGKSMINEQEKSNIITNMYSLPKENRLQYLLSVIGGLATNEKTDYLVLAMRSTRFYKSCSFLGRKTFMILSPLLKNIIEIISIMPCSSVTLDNIRFAYARNRTNVETLKLIIARVIFVALYTQSILPGSDAMSQVLISIVSELIDTGLLGYLNTHSVDDPVLRSIEFDVDKSTFMEMFRSLLDSLYIVAWSGKGYPLSYRRVKFPNPEDYSGFLKELNILKKWMIPDGVSVETRVKKGKKMRVWMRNTAPTMGIVDSMFRPLDEEDQDNFEAGYDYLSDPEEDLEFEGEGEAPNFRFVVVADTSKITMMSVRGTAHKVLIKTNLILRDLFNCYGVVKIRCKKNFSCLEDYLANYGGGYVYIGNEGKNFDIEGTKSWSMDDHNRITNRYPSDEIKIDSKMIDKVSLSKDPNKLSKIVTLDNYFLRLREDSAVEPKVEEIEEEMITNTQDFLRDDFDDFKKKAIEYLTSEEEPVDTAQEEEDGLTVEKIIDVYNKNRKAIEDWAKESTTVKNITEKFLPDNRYNFAETLHMLYDAETLGEFNALFGNSWSKFENNEIRLTDLTKRVKIERGIFQITRLQPHLKEKYSKILFLLTVLLAAIPTVSDPRLEDHQFSRSIDELFDIEVDINIPFEIMNALQPNAGEISKPPDLDRIFGRKKCFFIFVMLAHSVDLFSTHSFQV
jgi:hypothetical protein